VRIAVTTFKTKNGLFATSGTLEKNGLAVAFNCENFLSKLGKLKKAGKIASENWREDVKKLIATIHTVLAQHDPHTDYPFRMLNAGGILTLVAHENERTIPLGIMMVKECDGLQLGFGKVELRDLDNRLSNLQIQFDSVLRSVLLKATEESSSSEELINKINSDKMLEEFSALQSVVTDHENEISDIFSGLEKDEKLQAQASSFNRPPLNRFTVKAIKAAAIREISEEIEFTIDAKLIEQNRLAVKDCLSREEATYYVRNVLTGVDQTKFSAKEFNNDFESTAFIVHCVANKDELSAARLHHKDTCMLIFPNKVQINVTNAEKGTLQTTIEGCPPILGGGNQFTVALFCHKIFGIVAAYSCQHQLATSARQDINTLARIGILSHKGVNSESSQEFASHRSLSPG
jgi:hypothetical protein